MLSLTLELERDQSAPARARTMVRGLRPLLGTERTEDATLLVSELVTNAIRHAGRSPDDEIRLEARYRDGSVRVAVHDGGPGFDPYTAPRRHNGGHGLILVDRLADDWGVEPGVVWATLTWG